MRSDARRRPLEAEGTSLIAVETERRFAAIGAEDNLRGLGSSQFAARAAEHLNELNVIHPFLDGNGRAQRAFLEILARQAGHQIDTHVDRWCHDRLRQPHA